MVACLCEIFRQSGDSGGHAGFRGHKNSVDARGSKSVFADGANCDEDGLAAEIAESLSAEKVAEMMHR